MNIKGILTVLKKELTDLFRDRKTIIVGILLPLLIFPLLYGFMGKSMDSTTKKVTDNLKIAIEDKNSQLGNFIRNQKNIVVVKSNNPKQDVQDGKIYLALVIPNDFDSYIKSEKQIGLTIIIDDTSQTSEIARGIVNSAIEAYKNKVVKDRLLLRKIDISILNPISIKEETAAKEKGGFAKYMLSLMLPMFLIVYSLSSPMAAAIDLGAGEKERGTLEPLLTTQSSRMNLLFGKLFAITVMGIIGTTASMIGLALSFKVSKNLFGGDVSMLLPASSLILIGLAALFLTMIFGAVELAISIYARSFKEAQTYLTPFTLIGMVAAFGTYTIDAKNIPLSLFNVPLANLSLIMKEFIAGIYNPLHIGLTFGWVIIYIIASVLFARYMFSREEVIFRT